MAAVRLRPEAFRKPSSTEPTDAAASVPASPAAPDAPAAVVTDPADAPPAAAPDYIVEVEGLTKVFKVRGSKEDFAAVKDVSFAIPRGETVAIVGESGSGKTTTARMMLKVVDPTSGAIRFDGQDVASLKGKQLSSFRQRVQPIFQDPYSSLNPMFSIERIITEPLDFYKRGSSKERSARVRQLLDDVALPQIDAAAVSLRALGRPASARRDRARARPLARPHRVRRAGLGAGRARAGPDPDACCATCSASTA